MRTVEQIKADYERAVAAGNPTWITFWDGEVRLATARGISQSRLEEICDAERDGRCVVLPCKVGDKIWVVSDGNAIECMLCDMLTYKAANYNLTIGRNIDGMLGGKQTVFRTPEDAGIALRGELP